MSVRNLIPWGRRDNHAPTVYRDFEQSPFLALHREVNRLFDDVFRGFDMLAPLGGNSSWSANWPSVELSETENELRAVAEVPGLEEARKTEQRAIDGIVSPSW